MLQSENIPTCMMRALYAALRDSATVARSPGIISTIRAEPRNSRNTSRKKKKKKTRGVVGDHFSKVANGRDTNVKRRNKEDKDGNLDGRERNKEKRKEMKACQSYVEQSGSERRSAEDAIAGKERENGRERRRRRSRRVLAGLKGGCEEREFPLSYIFFLVFSSVPWEKFVV